MRIILLCFVTSSLFGATSSSWVGTTNDWNTSTNWTPDTVPNVQDAVAVFPATTTPIPMQPNLTASATVGTIRFNSTAPATISSSSPLISLTFSVSTGSASIVATTTGHIVSAPVILSSNLATNISQNMTITLSGVISGTSSLTVGGLGTTALSGTNSFQGDVTVSSGILQVNSDSALGVVANTVTINSSTFQVAATMISPSRSFILGGTATFDTNGHNLSLKGVVSGGALAKTGAEILTLTGVNTYTGGTTVTVGTLNISQDQNLGAATGPLALAAGTTLQAGASYVLGATRPVSVTGAVTIDTNTHSPTIASAVTGTGSINVIGSSGNVLALTGANTYSGPTTVNTVTMLGNTTSLQGAINVTSGGTVTFNQSGAGTYAGAFNGTTPVTTLNLQGGGTYTFTGDSSASKSTTNLSNSHLILTGSLGSSLFNIESGSNLSGTGTVTTSSGLTNSGKITPGTAGAGTLNVNGNVTFTPGSGTLVSEITPLTNGLLNLSGTATLTNGILDLQIDPTLFFPLTSTHTLLNAGSRIGTFGSILISNPQFTPSITYTPTSVILFLTNLRPFNSFPFGNANERAVGRNIDALSSGGFLSPDLTSVINSLAGLTVKEVNRALDQMHPPAMSAFAELQTTLGGQLLSLFHRKPGLYCGCDRSSHFWVEPYGNWLQEKKQGMQIGFQATTRGVSLGFDHTFFNCWTLGLGGAYNATDLRWSNKRGYAYVKGAYAALYSDISVGRFYLGGSAYAGKDWYDTIRHIRFTTIDRQAKSHSQGIDLAGQLTTAYFFGIPSFHIYPYATVDYLYLKNSSFTESGALSLDLKVQNYTSSTLRAESGLGLRFTDRNRDDTICVTPLFSMGYVLELPLHRQDYRASFVGMPISFRTEGWDMAWQVLNLRFGLALTYRSFTLDSQYIADISPEGNTPYVNQRANFKFSLQF